MALFLVFALLGAVFAENTFEEWEIKHEKLYDSFWHRQYRKEVWTNNMNDIIEHNIRFMKGETSFKMAMNKFGDLTPEEYSSKPLSDMMEFPHSRSEFLPPASNFTLPSEIDYRKDGYVTDVKDEHDCGACWAFSATGSLEGQLFRKTGKLLSLSEQQLIDCSWNYGNYGCNGGRPDSAFQYMIKMGSESEASYPYLGEEGRCGYEQSHVVGYPRDLGRITSGKENSLSIALAVIGPISVAMDASQKSFQFYSGGVYNDSKCRTDIGHLTRAALLVGYGTTEDGARYYIVKNSQGKDWGEEGYMRLLRNGKNFCGIATLAAYPVV